MILLDFLRTTSMWSLTLTQQRQMLRRPKLIIRYRRAGSTWKPEHGRRNYPNSFNKNLYLPIHQTLRILPCSEMAPPSTASSSPDNLILVDRRPSGIAVITINRPGSLNSLTRPMLVELARTFKSLDDDPAVGAVVIFGRGRAFCSGIDLTAAEEVFKGDVKDQETDPVVQMERCRKPIIGAVAGFAVTAGFEIALACDIIVAGKDAKFVDTHSRFGIFPSWGLSQKLSRVIGPNRARQVSLSCMPVNAELAEKWGLVNQVVDEADVLNTAVEVAENILKNNRDMVLRYKSVINDGFKLDLNSALKLEKERAHEYYNGMTKEQFSQMQTFISGRGAKSASKL